MPSSKIVVGDCARALNDENEVGTASIDLVVTSPPYDAVRRYSSDEERTDRSKNTFPFDLDGVIRGLARVVKPGGVVVWVADDTTVRGEKTGSVHKAIVEFMRSGSFALHDTMIWSKGSASHYAVPGRSTRYSNSFETMAVFVRRGGATTRTVRPKTVNLLVDRPNATAGRKLRSHYTKRSMHLRGSPRVVETNARAREGDYVFTPQFGTRFNVWNVPPGKPLPEAASHPAVMNASIARDHILTWSNPGDVVLDPFAGSGTTLVEAVALGRHAVGVERSPEYAEVSMSRVTHLRDD